MDYLIKKGDTLSQLAATNKTDVGTLLKLNPSITNPDLIYAGATLKLPGATPPVVPPTNPVTSLADKYGTTSGISTSDQPRFADQQKTAEQLAQDQKDQAELARLTTKQQLDAARAAVAPTTAAPTSPNLVQTYNDLRTSSGVGTIEEELAGIKKQKLDLQNELRAFDEAQRGQGTAAGVVDASVAEKSRVLKTTYDRLTADESVAVDRLNAKNSYISTVMNLTGQDYANSVAQYDKEFSRNVQLQSQLSTDQNRVRDDARAYLTTVSNFIQQNGKSIKDMDPGMQAEIHRQELQAGFPVGTLEAFATMKPKANLLATKEGTDANGNGVISFIYADENGNPGIVKTVKTGTKSTTSTVPTNITTEDGFSFTTNEVQDASAKANIPLDDLKKLPGKVINVFVSGAFDTIKKRIDDDLKNFVDPSEIEGELSNEASLPDAVKDALVRYLKSQAGKYQ